MRRQWNSLRTGFSTRGLPRSKISFRFLKFCNPLNWCELKLIINIKNVDGSEISTQVEKAEQNIKCLSSVALSTEAEDGGDPSPGIHLHHKVGSSLVLPPQTYIVNCHVSNSSEVSFFFFKYLFFRRKDTRKIAAQKFYSLLVLQKVTYYALWTLSN